MPTALVFLIAILGLNTWATLAIGRDTLVSSRHRALQVALVWLVPIVGAVLTLLSKPAWKDSSHDRDWNPVGGGEDCEEIGKAVLRSRRQETVDLLHVENEDRVPKA